MLVDVLYLILGLALLVAGGEALVRGAVALASDIGVSETIIGLTIVSAGTSTPELITSLVAARRGQADIAVGNVVGSNVFNVLGIAGATATVIPLTVPPEILSRDILVMIAASALLFPMMRSGYRISRFEGAVLFVGFLGYTAYLIQAGLGAMP